jgi:hypothetical protein
MRAITLSTLFISWIALLPTPAGSAAEPGIRDEPIPAAGREAPRKLALLVGIGKYSRGNEEPKWKDWWDLASRKDVEKIAGVLTGEHFGFKPADVLSMLDEQATREGIVRAFRAHLIDQARPGDAVYFHYSGHGQQVPDNNGDEFDGLDESLVTIDYVSQKQEDGAKTNLRDDTLGQLLEQLQQKMSVGGQFKGSITVTLDSCFSGSGTRGDLNGGLQARGRTWDTAIDGPKPNTNPRGKVDGPAGLLAEGQANAKNYVLLTAASYDQLAAETDSDKMERIGLFTDAWVKALETAPDQATVRDVYEDVYGKVTARATRQDPTLEGNGDTLLFSGVAVPRSDYVVVQSAVDNDLTLPVGETFGVTSGSAYAIYKRGGNVSKSEDKIAEAEITQVSGATCTATLTEAYRGKLNEESLRGARAVEISHNYRNEKPLRVFLAEELPAPVTQAIVATPVVKTDGVARDDHDVLARLDKDNKKLLVLEDELGPILTIDLSSRDLPQQIKDTLLRNWRKRFLMRVASPVRAGRIRVDTRLVPVEVKAIGDEVDIEGPRTDARAKVTSDTRHSVNLEEGEYFQLEVRNLSTGTAKVYFTVLHFKPDGKLEVDYPEFEEAAVAPGQEWIPLPECVYKAKAFQDGRPAKDVYKVFATRVETKFGDLLPQRGEQNRSPEELTDVFRGRRGEPRGQMDDPFDLDRMIGYATLGRDPAPDSKRSENVRSRAADWNVTTLTVTTRPGMKR